MKYLFLLLFTTALLELNLFAQLTTQTEELLRISGEAAQSYQAKKTKAIEWALKNNQPVTMEIDGSFAEIQYIDEYGQPQYYKTDNANAAATISTNKVYPGGGVGLSLTGSGVVVREWDAGNVLSTHQEFGGRVTNLNTASTHYHSTHVAGTILASGIVSAAKGMAYQATLRSFDWNSDVSEMASEAVSGMLMSNHSYGFSRGWSQGVWYGNPAISSEEDYLFGFYDSYTRSWDQVAYNAPYYLICKSAGNDRGESGSGYPADGPYDCIGQQGVAKDVLTVGAVADIPGGYTSPASVVMSSFSSWGPADDGRIKPDIVANGISLYSTDNTSTTSYLTLSGTSMATPSVCGSLALLQQHYYNLNGTYMLASTLKALVVHTADEAGSYDGPDYKFGWGLMNTKNAALKISEDQTTEVLSEFELMNGGMYSRDVIASGAGPLKVTIVWTDPAGSPVPAQLDPITPMLVNDLDLRITHNGSTYYPWKLDRDNPADPATNDSENNVDNVEVVYIASPIQGDTYTIKVDHDGTLSSGSQVFSIVISGIADVILPPTAEFTVNKTNPIVGETVNFTDLSTNNPVSYNWSFEPSTVTFTTGTNSASVNPKVQFNEGGYFTVSLTVINIAGSDNETKTDYILVTPPPVADFSADNITPTNSQTVTFTDLSTNNPTNWSWNFEPSTITFLGGTNASSQNPQLLFNYGGYYTVSLTVSNVAGSDSETKLAYIYVVTPTVADFEADDTTPVIGQLVSFINLSTNFPTSAQWTFEPSTVTYLYDTDSSSLEPILQFESTGDYTVSLFVANAMGPDSLTKTNYIHVVQAGLWYGKTSSDWNTASNWDDNEIPFSMSNIIIQPPVANWPIYNGDLTVGLQCGSITMNGSSQLTITGELKILSGKTITVNDSGRITISGNWNNSGMFNPGFGTVEFTGINPASLVAGTNGAVPVSSYVHETFSKEMVLLSGASIGPSGDDASSNVNIGFAFNYLGSNYNYVNICTNGWLSLNRTGGTSNVNEDLFTSTVPNATLAPWFDNLKDDAESTVSFKLEGSSPQRVFTAEWNRLLTYQSGADARISFQVKLYETSNVIEFIYGDMEAGIHSNSESASIGIEDITGGSGHFIEATTGSTTVGVTGLVSSTDWPDVNYRFYTPIHENFNTVVINKIHTAFTVDRNISIAGNLIVDPNAYLTNNGTYIKIDGNAIFKADTTGTASFINYGVINLTGAITYQQYLSSERWHLVSSPVSYATINTYYNMYLKEYNEPSNSWTYLFQPTSLPMNVAKGYAVWASDSLTGSKTVNFTGSALNNNDFAIAGLDYTPEALKAGFNLLGNPYPCAIDWNENWSTSNLSGWVVLYDNGVYRGWHPTLFGYNGKTNGIIPTTNAFWVRAVDYNASLTIPASERVHDDQDLYKSILTIEYPEIKLSVAGNGYADEAVVIFHPEGTNGFDGYYDLETFENIPEAPKLFSLTPVGNLSVNVMPPDYDNVTIPLGFEAGFPGQYAIDVSTLVNFNTECNSYLQDLVAGSFSKLTPGFHYAFTYEPYFELHRFNLHFTKNTFGIGETNDTGIKIYSYRDVIYVKMPDNLLGTISVFDLTGAKIAVSNAEAGKTQVLNMSERMGYFLVKVQTRETQVVDKVFIKK